jgi:pre-peptidase
MVIRDPSRLQISPVDRDPSPEPRTSNPRLQLSGFGVVRYRRLALPLLLALTTAYPLAAAEPVVKDLQPRGGQRGKTFTLTLKGEGLVTGAELITTLPGTISKLAPPRDIETPDTVLSYLVQLPEDAAVGAYPVRVRTADGLSNVLILSVSDLPEIPEKEPNDSLEQAQPITVPIAVSGTLKGPDQDFFSFTANARQRLVLEVEARRIGSAIDPVIEVFDSTGHRIAENDDAPGLGVDSRLDLTFPKAGKYYVGVHDAKFSEQAQNFYRLKVGSYAYAEGIFPLGWQRGKGVAVTMFGGNLAKPIVVHPDLNVPAGRETTAVSLPGRGPIGSLPFRFRLSDLPETLAPADGSITELAPSTVMNGRILKPGEIDRYKLKVSPGEKWMLDLEAATLGTSSLYGSLAVFDAQGKKLEAKDVGDGPDPKLAFTVPDKVREVTLGVSDVRGQGGPSYGYRLIATSGSGDFSLKILTPYVNVPAHGTAAVQVVAERHGYDGPIRLSIPNLPPDFSVAGGNIAAEVLNYEGKREPSTIGYLTLTAKPEAKPRALELSIWGEGGAPDRPIRRRAEGPGLMFTVNGEEQYTITADLILPKPTTYGWLGIDLPVGVRTPAPAVLEIADRSIRAVQGMDYPIAYKLVKQTPAIVTKNVGGLELPTVKDLGLENKSEPKGADAGKLTLRSTLETPLVKFDLVPSATVEINGKEETVVAPAVAVELVRAYSLELKSQRVELTIGGKAELTGLVRREPIFTGTVKISVGDPPDKVSCTPVEVPNPKSEFSLTCEAASGTPQGDFEVHLVSSATIPGRTDKREYAFPPVAARMIIAGEKTAQTVASKSR